MANQIRYYRSRCRDCGKIGTTRAAGTPTGGTPARNATPPAGKCPANANGVHRPMWEPA